MGRKKGIDKLCSSNAVDFGSSVKSNLSELAGFSLEDREKYEKSKNSSAKIKQETWD